MTDKFDELIQKNKQDKEEQGKQDEEAAARGREASKQKEIEGLKGQVNRLLPSLLATLDTPTYSHNDQQGAILEFGLKGRKFRMYKQTRTTSRGQGDGFTLLEHEGGRLSDFGFAQVPAQREPLPAAVKEFEERVIELLRKRVSA